jgi:periplasmic divalent cation tolerance protein
MGTYDTRLLVCATTFPEAGQAHEVVRQLVRERLVVCGQVGQEVTSYFWWEGEVAQEAEVAVRLKIRDDRFQEAMARMHQLHPYETPQLVSWAADHVDEAYGCWAWEESP